MRQATWCREWLSLRGVVFVLQARENNINSVLTISWHYGVTSRAYEPCYTHGVESQLFVVCMPARNLFLCRNLFIMFLYAASGGSITVVAYIGSKLVCVLFHFITPCYLANNPLFNLCLIYFSRWMSVKDQDELWNSRLPIDSNVIYRLLCDYFSDSSAIRSKKKIIKPKLYKKRPGALTGATWPRLPELRFYYFMIPDILTLWAKDRGGEKIYSLFTCFVLFFTGQIHLRKRKERSLKILKGNASFN